MGSPVSSNLNEQFLVLTQEIVHLTLIVLKRKNFSFNSMRCLQKQGTAIETHLALSYASIFMGRLKHA